MRASDKDTGEVVDAHAGDGHQISPRGIPTAARLAGRVFVTLAELALMQMGTSGALVYCEYLTGWWAIGERPSTGVPDSEGS